MRGSVWLRWQEFEEACPFGPLQDAVYHGTTASLLYNANRGKGQKALEPQDFFPALKAVERRKTLEEKKREQYRRGLAWAAILGAQARNARKRQG